MSFFTIPMQCEFLSNEMWDEEMDKVMLDALIEQRLARNFDPLRQNNYHALLCARGILNGLYSADIGWEDVLGRFEDLRKRYDTFKFVVEHDKIWYDPSYNKVKAERSIWKKIWKVNEFAKDYVHDGEPEWVNLEKLFKPPPTTPIATEVIEVSDSPIPPEPNNNVQRTIIVSNDDDEVVSPLLIDRPRSRKKFIDEIYASKFKLFDADETKTVCSSIPPKEDVSHFSPHNAFPPRPKLLIGDLPKNTGSSSCSSSIPVKWFHFGKGDK